MTCVSEAATPGGPSAACYHQLRLCFTHAHGFGTTECSRAAAVALSAIAASRSCAPACVPAPVATPAAPAAVATPAPWEQKLAWIVRLEDQRILREPNPPAPQVLRPATAREPALLGPAAPADLLVLMRDREARVRRRAALARGTSRPLRGVALPGRAPEGRGARGAADGRLRAWASSAIPAARGALLEALSSADPHPARPGGRGAGSHRRQDRRAGRRRHGARARGGGRAAADRRRRHWTIRCRRRSKRRGWDSTPWPGWATTTRWRRRWWTNAARPCPRWWPVAYALQRVGDPRAAPALTTLLTPGALHGVLRDPRAGRGQGHDRHPPAADAGAGAQGGPRGRDPGDPRAGRDGRCGRVAALSRADDGRIAGRGRAQRERDGIRHAGRSPLRRER